MVWLGCLPQLRDGRGIGLASLKEAFAAFVARIEALLDTPNLLISPHMGWSSRQARSRLVQTLARHLKAYVSY